MVVAFAVTPVHHSHPSSLSHYLGPAGQWQAELWGPWAGARFLCQFLKNGLFAFLLLSCNSSLIFYIKVP